MVLVFTLRLVSFWFQSLADFVEWAGEPNWRQTGTLLVVFLFFKFLLGCRPDIVWG